VVGVRGDHRECEINWVAPRRGARSFAVKTFYVDLMSGTPSSLSEKRVSLRLCENFCVSVVKLLAKTLTTEAQRSHRGTEINFSDRLFGVRS